MGFWREKPRSACRRKSALAVNYITNISFVQYGKIRKSGKFKVHPAKAGCHRPTILPVATRQAHTGAALQKAACSIQPPNQRAAIWSRSAKNCPLRQINREYVRPKQLVGKQVVIQMIQQHQKCHYALGLKRIYEACAHASNLSNSVLKVRCRSCPYSNSTRRMPDDRASDLGVKQGIAKKPRASVCKIDAGYADAHASATLCAAMPTRAPAAMPLQPR
ncbi:MAG: hypothetical protein LBJ10_06125 [Clostridiales bacterium]|jgi:hypothetical protein|nr:hypothetical protein [Clostridiales bacterium]